jgi:hypothetical protein
MLLINNYHLLLYEITLYHQDLFSLYFLHLILEFRLYNDFHYINMALLYY